MEDGVMQRFIPALKILLIGSIGVILMAMILNLVVGNTSTVFQMMYPLLMGLFAFGALTNFAFAAPKCPTCATQQPVWRMPTSSRQALFGGWTCPQCGTEIDRKGEALVEKNGHA
jgi:hypothetical protein